MGCASCGKSEPKGCGNKGHCLNGGCNKMNTFDWFSAWQITDNEPFDIVEVSFKNGSRKTFFKNPIQNQVSTGDFAVVDSGNGYDVGKITLSGELVRLQLAKKKVTEDRVLQPIVRLANERDIERLKEARQREHKALVKSRAIARSLGVNLKMGDVEYQADLRKATFFYTAEGRVDFRELVRAYAREFNVKIEMRQIGSRQESARLGGIGSCGRELCCSTWLSDFKSVPTVAARYQNLAINQTKLSGQCGRLKCCLNYELDTYIDALSSFPMKANSLKTKSYIAYLIKADIFKDQMHYSYKNENGRNTLISIDKDRVREIWEMNKTKEYPDTFLTEEDIEIEEQMDYAAVTGFIELKEEVKRKKKRRGKRNSPNNRNNRNTNSQNKSQKSNTTGESAGRKTEDQSKKANDGSKPESKDGRKPNPRNKRNNNRNRNQKARTEGNTGEKQAKDQTNDQAKPNPNKQSKNKRRRPQGKKTPKTDNSQEQNRSNDKKTDGNNNQSNNTNN